MDYSILTARQQRAKKFLKDVALYDLSLDGQKCSICHELFLPHPNTVEKSEPEPLVRTGCGHIFGEACILHWLKYSETCPYCRTKLPGSEPLNLEEWRAERESIIQNVDAIVKSDPHRRLPSSCKRRCEMTNLVEKPPGWLCALRFKGFLLLETSTDKIPTEPMQQLLFHFAADPTRMTNFDLYMTTNYWVENTDFRAMGPAYCWNADDVLRAVARDLRMHGVRAFMTYEEWK